MSDPRRPRYRHARLVAPGNADCGVLPPGTEAFAVWPNRNQLWAFSEVRDKGSIYAMDLDLPG